MAALTTTSTHKPLPLEGAPPPRPKSSSLIFLKSSLAVEDEPCPSYTPYFEDGDDDFISKHTDLFDMKELKRRDALGPPYQEKETLETIDEVLKLMAAKVPGAFGNKLVNGAKKKAKAKGATQSDVKLERIHHVLAELTGVKVEIIRERHSLCFVKDGKCDKLVGVGEVNSKNPDSNIVNSDTDRCVPYASIMNSYSELLCRTCFAYDCNVHGNLPKANPDLLGELAVQKELGGHWTEVSCGRSLDICYGHVL